MLVEFWGTLGKFYSEIRTKRLEIRENIIVLFNIAYIKIAFTDTEISKILRISSRLGGKLGGPEEILRTDRIQRLKIHRGSILTCKVHFTFFLWACVI